MRRAVLATLALAPAAIVVACGADVRLGSFVASTVPEGGDELGAPPPASVDGSTSVDAADEDARATGADAACTIDCKGNPCVNDVCLPLTLATGQTGVEWITQDATDVFWTTTGHAGTALDPNVVARTSKAGGAATVILNAEPGAAYGVAVDGALAFWLRKDGASGTVSSASKVDGTGKVIVGNLPNGATPQGLTFNTFNLFAVDEFEARAFQRNLTGSAGVRVNLPLDGGGDSIVAGEGVAIATDLLFVADRGDNAVKMVLAAGGVVAWPVGAPPVDVAYDPQQQIYYAAGTTLGRIPQAPPNTPVPLVAGVGIRGVAVDTTSVYFTTSTTVQKLDKGATVPKVLVTGLVKGGRLVVDGTYVYFADSGTGVIGRIPK